MVKKKSNINDGFVVSTYISTDGTELLCKSLKEFEKQIRLQLEKIPISLGKNNDYSVVVQ